MATPYHCNFNPLYNAGELTVDELMKQIDDYMDYYNRERCSLKLKKLSPVAYRTQLAQSA
ncbi:IS3 family transposase [Neisseria mucosa]|nr:IS3 family transposase [Neisseria mucosa]MDK8111258.1 IS3 family transposase [Neisseria mucosa]